MKDDAPTLVHMKYRQEKAGKQKDCESAESGVTGASRFSCDCVFVIYCVRVLAWRGLSLEESVRDDVWESWQWSRVVRCVRVVLALCTELYLRIEFLLFSPFLCLPTIQR